MLFKTILAASALVASVMASPMPAAQPAAAAVAEAQPNAMANSNSNSNKHRGEVFYHNRWYSRSELVIFIEKTFDSRRCHRRGEYFYEGRCEDVNEIVVLIFQEYGSRGGHSKREALPEASGISIGEDFGGNSDFSYRREREGGNGRGKSESGNGGFNGGSSIYGSYRGRNFNSRNEVIIFIEQSFRRCDGRSDYYEFEGECRDITTIIVLIADRRY